jgi:hypothetical protein
MDGVPPVKVIIGLLFVLSASAVQAQAPTTNRNPQQSPTSYTTINTDTVKKSIVFILYPRGDGKTEVGTGFLLQVPLKRDATREHAVIVTARHLLDPEWAGCTWPNPATVTVRVNTKDYKPGVSASGVWQASVPLNANGQRLWLTHPNEMIDVAVIPLINDKEWELLKQDDTQLLVQDFGTPEEIEKNHIGIGSNFISAGLVPGLWNEKRNYPAFKFGKISNVPDEPVKLHCELGGAEKDRISWLIAGNFVPGNSGSPVFLQPLEFSLGAPFQFTGPRNMIIGVLSGSLEGADIGEMVPIQYVFEILEKSFPDADLYRGSPRNTPR